MTWILLLAVRRISCSIHVRRVEWETCHHACHARPQAVPLPIVGEITEATRDEVAEGQPVLLLCDGRPVAVIVNLENWEEAELTTTESA